MHPASNSACAAEKAAAVAKKAFSEEERQTGDDDDDEEEEEEEAAEAVCSALRAGLVDVSNLPPPTRRPLPSPLRSGCAFNN
jgi:hypothetical protein